MSGNVGQKNTRLVRKLVFIVLAMFGFGYALVPLYDVFCDITGLNGKTNKDAVAEVVYEIDKSREITIEFITSVNNSAPIAFTTEKYKMKIHPGQYYTVNFYAKNETDKKMLARAIPSVTPGLAAEYLEKIECFCFSDQTFEPNQGKSMPVRFVVNPELPARYKTITLAYTFFDNTKKSLKNNKG
ncbi:MAG: cytochrome c oxidase assembly protein [Methylococcales bacterium]|nr:cytochrome c oxidase assembly protein [Methylococcales bacterium]